jgi:hypothetical protein
LTQDERRLLPLLGDAPGRWAAELGTGMETASAIAEALMEKLLAATADDSDHERVVLGLVDLSLGQSSVG